MRWDPLHDLVAWHSRTQHARTPDAAGWLPPVDVYETATAYMVIVELAGFGKDDFSLHASDESVTVSGERPPEGGSGQFLHIERGHGSFSRRFQFPQRVALGDVQADFKNGLLTITLPKLARNGPQRVPIRDANQD
jgi:HSP20 family protein